MARYIDADKLIKELIHREFYPAIVKSAIENAPTEDVVPKSEVEKYIVNMNAYGLTAKRLAEEKEQLKELIKVRKSCQEKLATKHGMTVIELEQSKQEVAREIFEEIATIFQNHEKSYNTDICELLIEDLGTDIAELKKKYIGE